ncbi:hypothetical protein GC163_18060 [bacterium]|nr:hypothetical protein [bacterium]
MSICEAPPVVADRLKPVERQWLDLTLLRGIGLTLIALFGPAVLWLLVDLFVNLPCVVRLVGLITAVSCGVVMAYRNVFRPLFIRLSLSELATWVDQSDERFQERVRTCLELEDAAIPKSRAARLMQRQVQRETWNLLDDVDWSEVLPQDRSYRTLGLGLMVLGLAIAPAAIWMSGYGLACQRLLLPFGNWGWGRNYAVIADQGGQLVARNSDVSIRAQARPRRAGIANVEQLILAWRTVGDSVWDERRLAWSADDASFVASLPRLTSDTEYRILGPSACSPLYRLRVVDPPALAQLTASIDPPGYTGLPSQQSAVGSDIVARAGSQILIRAEFDRPVAQAALLWPDSDADTSRVNEATSTAGSLNAEGTRLEFRLTAKETRSFVLHWTSSEGFAGGEPARRLIVIPDQPPLTRIEGATTLTLRPDDRQTFEITASDDFGLTRTELHLLLKDQAVKVWPLVRSTGHQRAGQWSQTIDLAAIGLKDGQAFSLRSRVVDNCEVPAPQERWSDPVTLVVSSSAVSAETKQLLAQTQNSRAELQRLMQQLQAQRQALRDLHQKTAAATVRQKDAEQAEQLARLEEQQAELNQQFDDWRERLPDTQPWSDIQQQAAQVREQELAQAQARIEAAQAAPQRDQIEQLSRSLDELAAAQKELQQLDDAIRALGNRGDEIDRLTQLANQSERLADQLAEPQAAEAAAPSDPASEAQPSGRNAPVAAAQEIEQNLQEILDAQPLLRAAMAAHQNEQLAETADNLGELANQQRALSEQLARTAEQAPASAEATENGPADSLQPRNQPGEVGEDFAQGQRLAEQAQQVAAAAQSLAEQTETVTGQDSATTQSAQAVAELAQQAATATERAELDRAAEAVQAASDQLNQSATDPAANAPGLAEESQQLQQQLQNLQQALSDARQSPGQQAGAQQQAQQSIANASQEVSKQLAEMSQQPGSSSAVTQAADRLNSAQPQQSNTHAAIGNGDAANAVQSSEAAAEQLEMAAAQLQEAVGNRPEQAEGSASTGAALTQAQQQFQQGSRQLQATNEASTAGPNGSMPPSTPEAAPSASATNRSTQNGQPMPGQLAAAENYRQAAQALRRAAQTLAQGDSPGQSTSSGQISSQQDTRKPGTGQGGQDPNQMATADASESLDAPIPTKLARDPRNWGRLQGQLKTDLLDGGVGTGHPEYRRQIQRYFETIAQPAQSQR